MCPLLFALGTVIVKNKINWSEFHWFFLHVPILAHWGMLFFLPLKISPKTFWLNCPDSVNLNTLWGISPFFFFDKHLLMNFLKHFFRMVVNIWGLKNRFGSKTLIRKLEIKLVQRLDFNVLYIYNSIINFGFDSSRRDMHLCYNFQMGTSLMVWSVSKKALKWVSSCKSGWRLQILIGYGWRFNNR